MRLTHTLTGEKEEFTPLQPPKVTIYVCGVTVYDDCHIGHARGALVFDALVRYLKFKGYSVTYVRNITDIDDKIIHRARHGGQTPGLLKPEATEKGGLTPLDLKERVQAVSEHYTMRFEEDFSRLGLLSPDHEPKATEMIPQMIQFIETILQRDFAYEGSDGVYFSIRKVSDYGRLSHQRLDQMIEGTRGEAGEGKRDPLDFALWKKAKPEEPSWDSPWGKGRPGWHIECSTMSTALLGDTFDIHGGGQDLIFPHHENEIAQAQGAGKPFARFWLHNGLLTVNAQKMSKSLGNFVTIPQVLEHHPPEVLRLFFLQVHYRSPLDFTWEHLKEAASAYDRLFDFLIQVDQRLGSGQVRESSQAKVAGEKFLRALEDDLNTPQALGSLYDLVAQAIPWWKDSAQGAAWLRHAAQTIRRLGGVLGFSFTQKVPPEIEELVLKREEARRRRDYSTADLIRRQIIQRGYMVEDTSDKPVVKKRA